MKRILSLALLCALGFASLGAFHNVEDMVYFAQAVRGKSVTIPAEFVQKKHDLMAKGLRMQALEVRTIAKQIKNPVVRAHYRHVASAMDRLADRVDTTPAVSFTKTFTHPGVMLLMKAKKAELMAELKRLVGEQLGDEKIIREADEVEKKIAELKSRLKKAVCPASEMMEGEDYQEDEDEGCDYCEGSDVDEDMDEGDEEGCDYCEGSDIDEDEDEGCDYCEGSDVDEDMDEGNDEPATSSDDDDDNDDDLESETSAS